MAEITQQNRFTQTPLSLLMACPGRLGRMLTWKESSLALLDRRRNQLGLLRLVKQVHVSRDTWKGAMLEWAPVREIEVEMTMGTVESTLPGGVLEFKVQVRHEEHTRLYSVGQFWMKRPCFVREFGLFWF